MKNRGTLPSETAGHRNLALKAAATGAGSENQDSENEWMKVKILQTMSSVEQLATDLRDAYEKKQMGERSDENPTGTEPSLILQRKLVGEIATLR